MVEPRAPVHYGALPRFSPPALGLNHSLKLGVQVVVSLRRLVLHLPPAFPFHHDWHRLALALGARAG